jgi:micrococcal nuclease
VLGALAVMLALLLLPVSTQAGSPSTLEGVVVRVVDGDTVHVRIGARIEKVRYIGVNAPEVHHPTRGEEPGGREATDVQARDRYGRLLAYVWVGDTMVNAELVRLGYAQVMTVPPNVRHQALFLAMQRDARSAQRGLWRRAALELRAA